MNNIVHVVILNLPTFCKSFPVWFILHSILIMDSIFVCPWLLFIHIVMVRYHSMLWVYDEEFEQCQLVIQDSSMNWWLTFINSHERVEAHIDQENIDETKVTVSSCPVIEEQVPILSMIETITRYFYNFDWFAFADKFKVDLMIIYLFKCFEHILLLLLLFREDSLDQVVIFKEKIEKSIDGFMVMLQACNTDRCQLSCFSLSHDKDPCIVRCLHLYLLKKITDGQIIIMECQPM